MDVKILLKFIQKLIVICMSEIARIIQRMGSQPTGDLSHPPGGAIIFRQACRLPSHLQSITALWLVLILPSYGG